MKKIEDSAQANDRLKEVIEIALSQDTDILKCTAITDDGQDDSFNFTARFLFSKGDNGSVRVWVHIKFVVDKTGNVHVVNSDNSADLVYGQNMDDNFTPFWRMMFRNFSKEI